MQQLMQIGMNSLLAVVSIFVKQEGGILWMTKEKQVKIGQKFYLKCLISKQNNSLLPEIKTRK